MRPPVPPRQLELARQHAETGRLPVPSRDAATVLLLRDAEAGPEVFMMVRRRSMAFAPGAAVFPGGGVDDRDRLAEPAGGGESAAAIPGLTTLAARMGCSADTARAVVRAAVRELAEETGVRVTAADLGLWDAWTTPLFEPRRYRTWFFTAPLPDGQEALEMSTESSSVAWVRPADALARVEAGEWTLLPPTFWACTRLATFASVADVMEATREATVEMFTPEIIDGQLTAPPWTVGLQDGVRDGS